MDQMYGGEIGMQLIKARKAFATMAYEQTSINEIEEKMADEGL